MDEFLRPQGARAASSASIAGIAVGARAVGSIGRFLASLNIWFWAIVGVPTLIAGVYYFGIAANLYVSEVKFIVRSPSITQPTGLAGLLQGSGLSQGQGDNYAVQEFIMSRDAVGRLDRDDDLRTVLDRREGDVITRFPGIFHWRTDFEALYKAYQRFVSVDIDSSTGISTLQVKAYRPEDAQMLAQRLLTYSEQLVNELNDRARQDALRAFSVEVADTQRQIAKTQKEMTAYRINQQFLDPKSAATGPVELLAQLNAQEANTKRQLADMVKNSPHSLQISLLKTRVDSLDQLIADERKQITGDNDSVAAKQAEYERLDVDVKLMEKQLDAALASLESAKLQAQRQQLYLETIATPNLPDYPLYPKRILSFAIVLVSCLLTYGIAWLLVASVREHTAA